MCHVAMDPRAGALVVAGFLKKHDFDIVVRAHQAAFANPGVGTYASVHSRDFEHTLAPTQMHVHTHTHTHFRWGIMKEGRGHQESSGFVDERGPSRCDDPRKEGLPVEDPLGLGLEPLNLAPHQFVGVS